MTNLTAALARTYALGDLASHPVKATSAMYEGSAIGLNAGYARHLATTDSFVGFAVGDAPSVATNGLADVVVRTRGRILLPIASVAVTDVGKPVYASDGNAFTLTQSTNVHIGRVVRVDSTGYALVEFDATAGGLGAVTELTDSSGGTPADTIAAIGASYVQAEVRNAIASLAAKVNAIARQIT